MRPSLAVLLLVIASPELYAQITLRVSLTPGGGQANDSSGLAALTPDGRYVCFGSYASNLVSGDSFGTWDVFVRDRLSGSLECISVDASGAPAGSQPSNGVAITPDARFVVFDSPSSTLVTGDSNGFRDVFVRDRQTGVTELVSVDSSGVQGNEASEWSAISADGRFVAFTSFASNLVTGDTNGFPDVFVRDRQTGTTSMISVTPSGSAGNRDSVLPSISPDGRFVSFTSRSTDLVAGGTSGFLPMVFLRDRQAGQTELVSVSTSGVQANFTCTAYARSLSDDGRYVVFTSYATNLVTGDTNGFLDVFLRDRTNHTTERVSVSSAGAQGNDQSDLCAISGDGRFVAFGSRASNLVAGDTNSMQDVFLRDRANGTTERVSVDSSGNQGDGDSYASSVTPDGRFVGMTSWASNLVSGDTNGTGDSFVHDRDATGAVSLCDPGVGGVIACPCGNPPGGPGIGCDNSSATGGAQLAASGVAYLAQDSLVFHTELEKQGALSILLECTALLPSGIAFGQGVRCGGGTLLRMYAKTAAGGSITAPESADPTVSARSAQLGLALQPGAP